MKSSHTLATLGWKVVLEGAQASKLLGISTRVLAEVMTTIAVEMFQARVKTDERSCCASCFNIVAGKAQTFQEMFESNRQLAARYRTKPNTQFCRESQNCCSFSERCCNECFNFSCRCLTVTQLAPKPIDLPGIERRWTFRGHARRAVTLLQFDSLESVRKVTCFSVR